MTLKHDFKQSKNDIIANIIIYAFFGLFIFVYLMKAVQPELLYFKLEPFFTTDKAYIEFHHDFRIGYISIIAQFLLQFLYYPVKGVLLITFFFLAVTFLFRIILSHTLKKILNGIEFIPVVIVLISLNKYSEGINTFIIFSISILILLCNHFLSKQKYYYRIPFLLFVLLVSYYLFGIQTSIMIATSLVFYEWLNNSSFPEKILITLISALAIGYFVLYSEGINLLKTGFIGADKMGRYALLPSYWYILFCLPSIFFISIVLNIKPFQKVLEKLVSSYYSQWYFVLLFILFTGLSFKKIFLNKDKYSILIDYYAYEQKWDNVLKLRNYVTLNDRISRFQLNRALSRKGLMAEDLFSVPQEWAENALFLSTSATRECAMNSSDLFFDMGFIKGSRYWAYEAQTFNPYSPRILKRLVLTNIMMGDHTLANKYLSILNENKIYKEWAQNYINFYSNHDTAKIKREQSVFYMANADSITYINNNFPARDILRLARFNPDNKMAYEYIMTFVLLRNELNNFLHFLATIKQNSKYTKLPKTYEEAILFFYFSKKLDPSLQPLKISKECIDKFNGFNKILVDYKGNIKLAQNDLHKYYGNTFWYYIAYVRPQVAHSKIQKRTL
jgi:hypothetical protein